MLEMFGVCQTITSRTKYWKQKQKKTKNCIHSHCADGCLCKHRAKRSYIFHACVCTEQAQWHISFNALEHFVHTRIMLHTHYRAYKIHLRNFNSFAFRTMCRTKKKNRWRTITNEKEKKTNYKIFRILESLAPFACKKRSRKHCGASSKKKITFHKLRDATLGKLLIISWMEYCVGKPQRDRQSERECKMERQRSKPFKKGIIIN